MWSSNSGRGWHIKGPGPRCTFLSRSHVASTNKKAMDNGTQISDFLEHEGSTQSFDTIWAITTIIPMHTLPYHHWLYQISKTSKQMILYTNSLFHIAIENQHICALIIGIGKMNQHESWRLVSSKTWGSPKHSMSLSHFWICFMDLGVPILKQTRYTVNIPSDKPT